VAQGLARISLSKGILAAQGSPACGGFSTGPSTRKRLPMTQVLLEMVRRAGGQADPSRAFAELLKDCVRQTCAATGRLYLLRLAQSAYTLTCQEGRQDPPAYFDISRLQGDEPEASKLSKWVILEKKHRFVARIESEPESRRHSAGAASRLLVPIVRDNTCLGVIDLDSTEPDHFTQDHLAFVEVAAAVAILLYEKEDTLRLLRSLGQPVDFQQPFNSFLDDVLTVVSLASGLPVLALHELADHDTLHCLKCWGPGNPNPEALQICPIQDFPPFHRAVTERKACVQTDPYARLARKFLTNPLAKTSSLVVLPLQVGDEVFGTLTLGALWAYEHTELDLGGYDSIATAVGAALTNYRHVHAAGDKLFEEAQLGAAITSLEVAQAARHEAKNYVHGIQERLVVIGTLCANPTKKDLERLRQHVHALSDDAIKIDHSLQKIKNVTKPPQREFERVCLRQCWEEAFGLVTGRLATYNIDFNIKGKADAEACPDFLKHAFLNLILNSIDAFREFGKKRNRLIAVAIDPQSDGAYDVLIRYSDNATGIDPSKLRPLGPNGGLRSPGDIFEPGVTSKAEGSGYGLFLVRKILADHRGSIDLADYRNGVAFQIKLPKTRVRS
jgi:signal transduction histidine kinase